MICKRAGDDAVIVTAEEPDDLLALRRVVAAGDRIVSETTRVVKLDREYARPDAGRRVTIRIAMDVEGSSLDYQLDRLRIRGIIAESSSESVSHGTHHSIVVKPNDSIVLRKRRWSGLHRSLLKPGRDAGGFVLVAIDTADCGIGRLKGTHLHALPEIHSGYSGKRYRSKFRIEDFLSEIGAALSNLAKGGDRIILFGPGRTKERLANYLRERKILDGDRIALAEGIDSGGEDGLHTFTKSDAMRAAISGSKLARVSSIIDEVMALAKKGSGRFTMGLEETDGACRRGAIGSLVFSEGILRSADEDAVVDLLNRVQEGGAETYSVDSSTDLGLRVDGLGGVVSLLRY